MENGTTNMKKYIVIIFLALFSQVRAQETELDILRIDDQLNELKSEKKYADDVIFNATRILKNLTLVSNYEEGDLVRLVLKKAEEQGYESHYDLNSDLNLIEDRYQEIINQIYRSVNNPIEEAISKPEFFEIQSLITDVYSKKETQLREFTSRSDEASLEEVRKVISDIFNPNDLLTLQQMIKTTLIKLEDAFSQKSYDCEAKIRLLYEAKSKFESKIKKENSISETLFKWGFPAFIIFIITLFVTPALLVARKNDEKIYDKIKVLKLVYGQNSLVEIATVFLLTSTILLLGLADKISGEILGTLLGGISGYVLGKNIKRKKQRQ